MAENLQEQTMPAQPRRGVLALVLFFLCFYFLLTHGHFFSTDEVHVYQTTRSIVERGDLSIAPMNDAVQGVGGQYYSQKGIAPSILSVPFYLAGKGLEKFVPERWLAPFAGEKFGENAGWGGSIKIFVVSLFNVFITALLCAFFYLCALAFRFAPRTALALTLIMGLSTIVCAYAQTYFQHTLVALCLVIAFFCLLLDKQRKRPWLLLSSGLCLGCAVLTRAENLVLVPWFLVYLLAPFDSGRLRKIKWDWLRIACFLGPVVVCTAIYLGVNKAKFGSPLDSGYLEHPFSGSFLEGLYGHLFSVGRSVFLYSPPLVLAAFCWRRFYRKFRWEMLLFAGCALTSLALYSKFLFWHGWWSWGNRFLLPVVPLLLFPLGELVEDGMKKGRWGLKALLASFFLSGLFIQLLGATPFLSGVYWNWIDAGLNPAYGYLFDPRISPIPMHWHLLKSGENIDFWLYHVYREYGSRWALLAAALPAAGILLSFILMWDVFRSRGGSRLPESAGAR
jgi:4-amino-4-deoxy-L-arabinose transferase-like glycosyltransferase